MAGWAPRFATSPPEKNRFAEKELRLLQTWQYRVRKPVGELLFWVFSVAILWRWWVSTGLWVLFGFGPKPGSFVVQKRNETPETPGTLETLETLDVDAGIAFL